MSFKIGNIEIKNNIVLAPMAGISNPTYIKLCEGFGLVTARSLKAPAWPSAIASLKPWRYRTRQYLRHGQWIMRPPCLKLPTP